MPNSTEADLLFEHRLVRRGRRSRFRRRRTPDICGCGWYGANHAAHVVDVRTIANRLARLSAEGWR